MKKPVNIKKIILPNLLYLLFALLGTKCGQAARLAPGLDFSQKALHILDGFRLAFKSLLPSFHPADLLVGLLIAAALRLAVYVKGKNAKKFRKNMEYGSARCPAAGAQRKIRRKTLHPCEAENAVRSRHQICEERPETERGKGAVT